MNLRLNHSRNTLGSESIVIFSVPGVMTLGIDTAKERINLMLLIGLDPGKLSAVT